MAIVAKRTVMTLYSNARDPYSHQVRIVLAEKGVNVDIHNVNANNTPEELLNINPYASVPTLVDRDLTLFQAPIIMEYLDERFPHPPLLPVYPVARAEHRKMMYRIENDWYSLYHTISNESSPNIEQASQELLDSLCGLEPIFSDKPYFLNDEFSLMDCCIAPLLWRLPAFDIIIPSRYKALKAYANRLFERDSFQASLTDIERDLRAA
jgi:stringent starvation protein A